MIVSGYQGIGKSTLAHSPLYIDLESSNFFVDGKRSEDWYKAYCNIAISLSEQGYTVFVSSHKVVRDYLAEHSDEDQYLVFPSLELKYQWIQKLEDRWKTSSTDKDYKAYMNALDSYEDNIKDLMNQSGFGYLIIKDMSYDLEKMLSGLYEARSVSNEC